MMGWPVTPHLSFIVISIESVQIEMMYSFCSIYVYFCLSVCFVNLNLRALLHLCLDYLFFLEYPLGGTRLLSDAGGNSVGVENGRFRTLISYFFTTLSNVSSETGMAYDAS